MTSGSVEIMSLSFPEAVRLIANYREISSEMLMLDFFSKAMRTDPDALMGQMINPAELARAWSHFHGQQEAIGLKARLRPAMR